jgi:PPM family protein phosphatase
VGIVRSENQDAIAAVIFNLVDDAAGQHLPMGVFLVADGMGGEAHGELASRIAARVVPAELLRSFIMPLTIHPALAMTEPELPAPASSTAALTQALGEAVALANRQIRQMAEYYRQDTGTTLTALAVSGSRAIIAHLGDSRAYLLRGGSMVQLTEDHTLLARLQAMDHPILSDSTMYVPRNFLYRSLGQEQAPPDLVELDLVPGDRVLICSDGLWDEVDDTTIQRELGRGDDPSRIAERLVSKANAAGGNDNSTALVLFVHATAPDTASAIARPEATEDAATPEAAEQDAAGEPSAAS